MVTYVFDSAALIAYFAETPGAPRVKELLKEAARGRSEILMSAVNFGEVYGFVLRKNGIDQAHAAVGVMHSLPIKLLDAAAQRCCHAAEIKNTYRLYYADSFAAALAVEHKATLVTSDSDFRRLGHDFPVLWLKQ